MRIKNRDLLKFADVIRNFEGFKYSTKFSYFITKNKLACKNEIEALEEARKPDQNFLDFERERIIFAREHSIKNSDGSPVVRNGSFIIAEDKQSVFNDKMAALITANKDVLDSRNEQMIEFEKLLNEETDFTGYGIKFNELPLQMEPILLEVFMTLDLIYESDIIENKL